MLVVAADTYRTLKNKIIEKNRNGKFLTSFVRSSIFMINSLCEMIDNAHTEMTCMGNWKYSGVFHVAAFRAILL